MHSLEYRLLLIFDICMVFPLEIQVCLQFRFRGCLIQGRLGIERSWLKWTSLYELFVVSGCNSVTFGLTWHITCNRLECNFHFKVSRRENCCRTFSLDIKKYLTIRLLCPLCVMVMHKRWIGCCSRNRFIIKKISSLLSSPLFFASTTLRSFASSTNGSNVASSCCV